MRTTASSRTLYLVVFVFMALFLPHGRDARPEVQSDSDCVPGPVGRIDQSDWTLKTRDETIEQACKSLGRSLVTQVPVVAQVVTLREDNMPYLSKQFIERPLWHVEVRDVSVDRADESFPIRDRYSPRTLDVFLDPISGCILKIVSRWPEGEPRMPPTVDAATAATQMERSGKETYHGFPTRPPRITFLDALRTVENAGWVPRRARQIVAEYVMWSRMGESPRAVWAIMLRGVPVFKPPPGTPKGFQDQYRHIIDAETGKWIWTSNLPRLDLSGPDGKRAGASGTVRLERRDPEGN